MAIYILVKIVRLRFGVLGVGRKGFRFGRLSRGGLLGGGLWGGVLLGGGLWGRDLLGCVLLPVVLLADERLAIVPSAMGRMDGVLLGGFLLGVVLLADESLAIVLSAIVLPAIVRSVIVLAAIVQSVIVLPAHVLSVIVRSFIVLLAVVLGAEVTSFARKPSPVFLRRQVRLAVVVIADGPGERTVIHGGCLRHLWLWGR